MMQVNSQPKLGQYLRLVLILMVVGNSALMGGAPKVQAATRPAPAATILTVDTATDLESGSRTKTCTYTAGVYKAATDGCTLRRAILEAAARPPADRPITIQFALPESARTHTLATGGVWTLALESALPELKTASITDKTGRVTIDGATQPSGRTDGPPIVLQVAVSLQINSTENLLRNLAFQGGGGLLINEDNNTIEQIWMGLAVDGQSMVLKDASNPQNLAGGGIQVRSDGNTLRANVILGANAKAIFLDGAANNLVTGNIIGARADGTVPPVAAASECLRSLNYDPTNWYGGWGISLTGDNNQVIANRIVGLHRLQTATETPPLALDIYGAGHTIRDNIIGVDSSGRAVGVCGQGIKISGHDTLIENNRIVRSRPGFVTANDEALDAAILSNDSSPLFGQITVRGNLVEDGPGKVHLFGPTVPNLLATFLPARITSLQGQSISGGSTPGYPCPNCIIGFYSDDTDAVEEALAYLGRTTADANGDFTFTLSAPLPAGQGVRTSSTTAAAGVIGGYGAGTTTELSKLYYPLQSVTITGAAAGEVGVTQPFTITVNPTGATAPYSYTVTATNDKALTVSADEPVTVATLSWSTPGAKTITVVATNELSSVTTTHTITLVQRTRQLYLPVVIR
jgi:hypothetical protein